MSVTIKYKGNTIASANTDTTKTLKTSGKYCEGDILVENVQDGGITPSGSITLTEERSYDVTDKATAVVDFSSTRANLAEAVTAKGVDTLPTSSFDTIATNIGLISGGGGEPTEIVTFSPPSEIGTATADYSSGVNATIKFILERLAGKSFDFAVITSNSGTAYRLGLVKMFLPNMPINSLYYNGMGGWRHRDGVNEYVKNEGQTASSLKMSPSYVYTVTLYGNGSIINYNYS